MMRLEVDSTEFVYIPVEATTTEGEDLDVTRIGVEVAFTRQRLGPVTEPWLPAVWRIVDDIPYARKLVGPRNNGYRLTPGKWWVWVRFHANPEVPVRRSDYLLVSGSRPSTLINVGGQAALVARPVAVSVTSAPLNAAATAREGAP